MKDNELYKVIGGASSISGVLINSIVKLINTVTDLGRQVGSSINYLKNKKTCK